MPQELPEELLDQIIHNVAAGDRIHSSWISRPFRETLLSISLASKTLCRMARPHLYQAFSSHAGKTEFYGTGMAADYHKAVEVSLPPLLHDNTARYLRTLCVRPEYGEMLDSLSVSMTDHESSGVPKHKSPQEHIDLALFQKQAQTCWFGTTETAKFQDDLQRALLKKSPDATICMVLLMCPNIRTLEIIGDFAGRKQFFHESLLAYLLEIGTSQSSKSLPQTFGVSKPEAALQRTLVLQHVQNVMIDIGLMQVTWVQIKAILFLPGLEDLQINKMRPLLAGKRDTPGETLVQSSSTRLESLVLERALLSGSQIAEILRMCPNLRSFRVDWAGTKGFSMQFDPAYTKIGTAISRYNPLLTSLTLGDWLWHGVADNPQTMRLQHSLRGLKHLTDLTLCDATVWRIMTTEPSLTHSDALADNLPPSIEYLDILEFGGLPALMAMSDDDTGAEDRGSDDFSKRRTRDLRRLLLDDGFPCLRGVTLYMPVHGGDSSNSRDPVLLHYVLTEAVRMRGWNLAQQTSQEKYGDMVVTHHKAILYREPSL